MAQKIVDLDQFADLPVTVKLKGQEYRLPADLPIPTMLRIELLAGGEGEDGSDDEKRGRQLYEEVLAIFRIHQPELQDVPLEARQLLNFIPAVYGGDEEPVAPDGEAKPDPTSAKRGTRSTSRTRKSASPKSSAR